MNDIIQNDDHTGAKTTALKTKTAKKKSKIAQTRINKNYNRNF